MTRIFQPLVLNRRRLQAARALIGGPACDRALNQFSNDLQELLTSLPETEPELRFVAHRLAGAAANLGFEEVASVSRMVARNGSVDARNKASAIDRMLSAARRATETLPQRASRD